MNEDIAANEARVREAIAAGEIADFTKAPPGAADRKPATDADQKPGLTAAFLRRLMLGLERDASGAKIEALLPGVRIKGARLIGALDLTDCSGAGGTGLPTLSLEACDLPDRIDLSNARLARLSLDDSRFRELWGVGLKIDGDLTFNRATPLPAGASGDDTAYIRLRAARIGGDLYGRGAKLVQPGVWPEALTGNDQSVVELQASTVDGNLILDRGFSAQGCVWLLGIKIGGTLQCTAARFANAAGSALVADNAEIGGSVRLGAHGDERFEAEGMVSILGAKIGRDLMCNGGHFVDPKGVALAAESAEIGGNVLLRQIDSHRFEAEGVVSLVGTRIFGDLDVDGAQLKHDGWALNLRNARIEGQLLALDNNIDGCIALSGLRVAHLFDDPDTGWGDPKRSALIDSNEIDLDKIGAPPSPPRPLWRARARWLRRNTGEFMGVSEFSKFSNQPWRQVASAFERAGLHSDARRIRRAEQNEANRFRPFWQRPFVWLFGHFMFGFGLSASRAALTAMTVWAIGIAGAAAMDARGALVASQPPGKPPLACENLQPPLYALDVALPVLDLKQESACEPGAAPGAKLLPGIATPFGMLFEEVALWTWAKSIYAVFAALIAGFALLTWTGMFKPRAEQ